MPRMKQRHPRKRIDHDCVFRPRDFQKPDPHAALRPSPVVQPEPPCHSDNHTENCSACAAIAKRQYAFDILVMGMEVLVATETAKGTYNMLDNIESLLVPPDELPSLGAEVEVSETIVLEDRGVRQGAERGAAMGGDVHRSVLPNTRKLAEGLPVEETINLTNDSDSDGSEEYFWTWDDECVSDTEITSSPVNEKTGLDNEGNLAREVTIAETVTTAKASGKPQMSAKRYVIEESPQGEVIILPEEEVVTEGSVEIEENPAQTGNIAEELPETASSQDKGILDVTDTDSEVIVDSQREEELLQSSDDETLESVDEAIDKCPEIPLIPDVSVQKYGESSTAWSSRANNNERKWKKKEGAVPWAIRTFKTESEQGRSESSPDQYVEEKHRSKSKKMKKEKKDKEERRERKEIRRKKREERKRRKMEKKLKREKEYKENKENYFSEEESEDDQIPEWAIRTKTELEEQYGSNQFATRSTMRINAEQKETRRPRRACANLNTKAEPDEDQKPELPTKRIKLDPEEGWPWWAQEMRASIGRKVKAPYTGHRNRAMKTEPGPSIAPLAGHYGANVKTESAERASRFQAGPSTSKQADSDVEILEDSDESVIEIDDSKDPDWEPDEDDIEELQDYFEISD